MEELPAVRGTWRAAGEEGDGKTRRRARHPVAAVFPHYTMGSPRTRLVRRATRREPSRVGRAEGVVGRRLPIGTRRVQLGQIARQQQQRALLCPLGVHAATADGTRTQPLDSHRLLAPTHGREREAGGDAAARGHRGAGFTGRWGWAHGGGRAACAAGRCTKVRQRRVYTMDYLNVHSLDLCSIMTCRPTISQWTSTYSYLYVSMMMLVAGYFGLFNVYFPRPYIATAPTIITPPLASPLAFKHDGSVQGGPARQFTGPYLEAPLTSQGSSACMQAHDAHSRRASAAAPVAQRMVCIFDRSEQSRWSATGAGHGTQGTGIGVASSLTWGGRERERVRHWEEQAQVPREPGEGDGGGPLPTYLDKGTMRGGAPPAIYGARVTGLRHGEGPRRGVGIDWMRQRWRRCRGVNDGLGAGRAGRTAGREVAQCETGHIAAI
ncbi:hypothetical protein DFH09DRAFT_1340126 [Mycena vulgaris]|nr:hypothetical protein DFH09DRAFT_1340126 [Mycena vulgaris]